MSPDISSPNTIKAVIFDLEAEVERCLLHADPYALLTNNFALQIGGVVCRSPLLAIAAYERENGLPNNYINCSITGRGHEGAWARYERGEMTLLPFYEAFGRELSDHVKGNTWYAEYCRRKGIGKLSRPQRLLYYLNYKLTNARLSTSADGSRTDCPTLPSHFEVNGRELFGRMMRESKFYDEIVLEAIHRIRASKRFRVVALTNNFSKSADQILGPADFPVPVHLHKWYPETDLSSPDAVVAAELEYLGWEEGATPAHLRALFDDFCDSSSMGMRKPDPKFYQLACQRNGVRPHQCIFLDDLGMNLKPAKALGMQTIHVPIGGSRAAIQQLGEALGIELVDGSEHRAEPRPSSKL